MPEAQRLTVHVISAAAVPTEASFAAALSTANAAATLRVPATVSAWDLLQKLRTKSRRRLEFAGADVLVDAAAERACTQFRGSGDLVDGGCYAALPRHHPLALAALEATLGELSTTLLHDPGCWCAWAARAWCQLLLGRPHCAAVDGMECQECAPFEPDGYGVVAEACLEMGGAAEARVHILNALSADATDDRLHHCLQAIEAAAKLVSADVDHQPEMKYSLLQTSGRGGCSAIRATPNDAKVDEVSRSADLGQRARVPTSHSEGRGVVLVATQNYKKNAVLWTEVPVVSVCLEPNRCQRCMLHVLRHENATPIDPEFAAPAAVLCEECGEVFCSRRCRNCADTEWHRLQCGATSRRIAQLRQVLWSEGKGVEHHYHVLVAARLSALALSRCTSLSGTTDIQVIPADCPELDEYYGVGHLVGLGDDAPQDILRSNLQPFAAVLKQYKLFCSLTGLGGASKMPAGRRFDFGWYLRIFGICIANSMQDHIGGDARAVPHVSLCAKGSLSNHSCTPNAGSTSLATVLAQPGAQAGTADPGAARPQFSQQFCANAMVFRARRDISAGDEINVTYISEAQLQTPAAQRRKSLQHYLFHCGCERCEAEDAQGTRAASSGDQGSAQSEERDEADSDY